MITMALRQFRLSVVCVLAISILALVLEACGSKSKDEAGTIETAVTSQSSTQAPSTSTPAALVNRDRLVIVSASEKICQLTGELDRQTNQPTASQTASRYGLNPADHGYSFEHNGKLFFLMGDPQPPTPTFKGQPNRQTDPPRSEDWNDIVGFTTDTTIDDCLRLDFVTYPSGAYKNPVVMDAQGQPAFTGATNESPEAGISDSGRMFVIFRTGNPDHRAGAEGRNSTGFATRTAVGVSDDEGNTFRYLYDFSSGPDARFINVAIAKGQDGYLYFWGAPGGELYRKSPPYLARKPVGSMGVKDGIEYLRTLNRDGTPAWTPNEKDAVALFHDFLPGPNGVQVADCIGEMGVEWNGFLKRFVLLYNCLDNNTTANPWGIYARVAEQPWGPWSAPQTLFNPVRDKGYCNFIHRRVTAELPACDNLGFADRQGDGGSAYGPYLISRFTTGDEARATTTFYHIVDTWVPYGQVIMKATISLQR